MTFVLSKTLAIEANLIKQSSSFIICFSGELSPCAQMNGGCHDLCLLTPDGRVNCSCRGDRILIDDNRCVSK